MLLLWQFFLGFRGALSAIFPDRTWIADLHKKLGQYGTLVIPLHPIHLQREKGAPWHHCKRSRATNQEPPRWLFVQICSSIADLHFFNYSFLMIPRKIQAKLLQWSGQYPVLTLVGPRQSGKTTLVRKLFPDKPYINLEDLQERSFAMEDPRGFLSRFPTGAILDEIQRLPQIMGQIQVTVDTDPAPGRFILTGSNQLALSQGISQSLAGRTAIGELYPFTLAEISQQSQGLSYEELLWKGFYPRIWDRNLDPTEALSFYLSTYVERDLRQVLAVKDLGRFQTFLQLAAGRVGQLLNVNALASDVGVAPNTLKDWIAVLEAGFILFRLPPYHANLGKRLTKSPKIYFWDVGLAAWLMGIREDSQIPTHPLRGQLFENLIIADRLKASRHSGQKQDFWFYRDSQGLEIDLITSHGQELCLREIKSGRTLASGSLSSLKKVLALLPGKHQGHLIYGGEGSWNQSDVKIQGWREALMGT